MVFRAAQPEATLDLLEDAASLVDWQKDQNGNSEVSDLSAEDVVKATVMILGEDVEKIRRRE